MRYDGLDDHGSSDPFTSKGLAPSDSSIRLDASARDGVYTDIIPALDWSAHIMTARSLGIGSIEIAILASDPSLPKRDGSTMVCM